MNRQIGKVDRDRIFFFLILILVLVGLSALIYPSFYIRWYADDYCVASQLKTASFSQYVIDKYNGWTGRYSSILFQGAYSLLGYKASVFMPSSITIFWWLALSWAIEPLIKKYFPKVKYLSAVSVAGFILLCLYSITPTLFQSLFWNNAAIHVCLPLIFLMINFGILARLQTGRLHGSIWLLPIVALTFIAGGFTEMFISSQITLYGLLVMLVLIRKNTQENHLLPFLTAALVTAIMALIIVAVAPGNQVRQAQIGEPAVLSELPLSVIKNTILIFFAMVEKAGWWTLALVAVSFLFSFAFLGKPTKDAGDFTKRGDRTWLKQVVLISLFLFVLILGCVAPAAYIQQQEPEARSVFIAIYYIILGIIFITSILGLTVKRSPQIHRFFSTDRWQLIAKLSIVLIIALGVGYDVKNAFDTVPIYQSYAQLWDQRHQEILGAKGSGQQEITTYQLDDRRWGVSDLREDPAFWVNQCMATYYDVDNISAKEIR